MTKITPDIKAGHGRSMWPELMAITVGFAVLSLGVNIRWVVDLMIFSIFVLSFDLLYGYLGHLSFGAVLYYGTGAYASALWLAFVNQNALAAIGAGLAAALFTVIRGFVSPAIRLPPGKPSPMPAGFSRKPGWMPSS